MTEFQRIRPMFADQLGLARGKYLPAGFASSGTKHCMTLFAQHYDRDMTATTPYSGFLTGLPDMEAVFDIDDARRGWDPGVGVVVADLEYEGTLAPWAPRTVLRRAIEAWQAHGFEPMVGIELECYLMEPNGTGGWKLVDTPGGFTYTVGPMSDPYGLLDEIMDKAVECEFPLESVNSEYDAAQYEFTLHYGNALEAVDNAFLFKQMAQEIARKKGLHLSFLGKPHATQTGCGLHINFSATDAAGANAFNDSTKIHGLADVARYAIGGLLHHHEALAALCAPTVNAYKRLQVGQMAGVFANWGLDHRGSTVRVPKQRDAATRIEYRLPDSSANAYLAVAATLQAAMLGIAGAMEPPQIEEGDCYETANTDRRTPSNLSEALDALEADHVFVSTIGPEMVANFVAVKRDEWAKFSSAITDWELNYYLPFI